MTMVIFSWSYWNVKRSLEVFGGTWPNRGMDSEQILIVTGFVCFAVGYIVHYELLYGTLLAGALERRLNSRSAQVWRILIARGSLVIAYLAIPLLVAGATGQTATIARYLRVAPTIGRFGITLGLSLLIVLLMSFNPGKERLAGSYPQMRLGKWRPRDVWLNLAAWAAYLFAYEFMFRGLLLVPLLSLGEIPAIAINTAIYSAVHTPKGRSEAVGAIPFGIIACLLALRWGSIWAPFVVHFALSAANFLVALRYQRSTGSASPPPNTA